MEYKLLDISDRTISFNFSNKIDQKINSKIVELSYEINRILDQLNIVTCYPTYNSLIVDYDPLNIERDKLRKEISEIIENFDFKDLNSDEIFEIDVNYGGNYGEDLKSVSEFTKLSEKDVIKIHSSSIYHVYMIGFSPGFPYLGGLNKKLICPRLDSPRKIVPAGSVGIADQQTGIYPYESSGGWRLIGMTDENLFDNKLASPSILKPGMKLKFNEI